MPVTVTYPGVYVEEIPSAVHTIVGVPTSIAAFVGAAERGPVNEATQVDSWTAYARAFGGVDKRYPMSWAVYLFFVNGGATAQIVRAGGDDGKKAQHDLKNNYVLEATSEGAWGDRLRFDVDRKNVPEKHFNLTVTEVDADGDPVTTERWSALDKESVAAALERSALVRMVPHDNPGATGPKVRDDPPAADGAEPPAAAEAPPAPKVAGKDPKVEPDDVLGDDAMGAGAGIFALSKVDIFNLLCLPTSTTETYSSDDLGKAMEFCKDQRAVLVVDPPSTWEGDLTYQKITANAAVPGGRVASYAAVYYPNLKVKDADGTELEVGPCGAVAGVCAATDATRGVWKAPAGTQASVLGVKGFSAFIDDAKSGTLNPLAVNALRTKPLYGPLVWGARTAAGADANANEWKYLPVRRTALYIEESLRRATQWAVFEPNDEPLWASLRLNVGVFMNRTWRRGAFQGSTPTEAYFVKCDKDVNTQAEIDLGIVNIVVGFAPLKPAEFVVISIQQLAGQLQT